MKVDTSRFRQAHGCGPGNLHPQEATTLVEGFEVKYRCPWVIGLRIRSREVVLQFPGSEPYTRAVASLKAKLARDFPGEKIEAAVLLP